MVAGSWLAPGKLFLAGEYAVVEGVPALVAAVAPWARLTESTQVGRPASDLGPAGRFPGAAPAPPGRPVADTAAFFAGGRKLGFGSSAAAAVLHAAHKHGLTPFGRLWSAAQDAHAALVGSSGSGGDIAASIAGGVGLFTPAATAGGVPAWQPLDFPSGACLAVVEAGAASNTRTWVGRFRDAARAHDLDDWLDGVRACVGGFAAANADWRAGFAMAADLYAQLTRWLGDGLYPPLFRDLAELGRRLDLPFKPSGAGGGDLAFFYCSDRGDVELLRSALAPRRLPIRLVRPTGLGLHRLPPVPAREETAPPWR